MGLALTLFLVKKIDFNLHLTSRWRHSKLFQIWRSSRHRRIGKTKEIQMVPIRSGSNNILTFWSNFWSFMVSKNRLESWNWGCESNTWSAASLNCHLERKYWIWWKITQICGYLSTLQRNFTANLCTSFGFKLKNIFRLCGFNEFLKFCDALLISAHIGPSHLIVLRPLADLWWTRKSIDCVHSMSSSNFVMPY